MPPPKSSSAHAPRVEPLSWDDYRLLVENVVDYAIFMLDVDGNIVTWNAGAKQIKGWSADEIIGKHFSIFYPPEDLAANKPQNELRLVAERGRIEDEGWRVRKDGSRFWANVVVTALRDRDGALRGFGKVTRDMSQRRAQLDASERRYRDLSKRLQAILEGLDAGITVQDPSGRLVFANTAGARMCGLGSVEELLAAPTSATIARFDVLGDDDRPIDPDDLPGRRVLRTGEPCAAVLRVREHATGRVWRSWVRAMPVRDEDGRVEIVINVMHDVTAAHRKEQHDVCLSIATAALGASLDIDEMLGRLTQVLVPVLADWCVVSLLAEDELRHVAIAHADPKKMQAARDVYDRFPPSPDAPRGLWNVLRSGVAELYETVDDELLRLGAQNEEHLALLRAAGMRSVILVPLRVRERVVGTLTLITAESGRSYDREDLRVAEELGRRAGNALENARHYGEAREAARRAEEASRTKDEFLATVSHELRTPLNAIVGWSSLLRARSREPSVAKGIEVIFRNAQAQVKIIDDILDVSRIINGKFLLEPKATDLVAIARDAIEVVRPASDAKQISVELVAPAPPYQLVADPERLQQVVWNLLSNAVKFTEARGRIVVRIERDASTLALSVVDSGKGIAPDFLPYAFDRFRQADASTTRRVGGLGLGLAIVRHVVELHGGSVEAWSEGIGKGATFTIRLPVRAVVPAAAQERPVTPHEPATPRARDLDGVRVLVVDDEEDARDLLAAVLTDAGATVESVRSAQTGLDALARFRPDVLVSDIGMPEEDGYSFIERIRALPPEEGGAIPSLALTAYTREEDRSRALRAGFTTHLGKPASPDALTAAVANLAAVVRGGASAPPDKPRKRSKRRS